ncbi:MAG TPA: hypothetical protein VGM38_09470 [Pseudolysinimonas sp.]|jgi:hypothetical protein
MKPASVLTIIRAGNEWNWQVYPIGSPSSHGTATTFDAAWAAVSAVVGAGTAHTLEGRIDGEAGPP